MTGSLLTFRWRRRFVRAQWTWRGNRQLVHASVWRSAVLTVRAFFQEPPEPYTQERRRLKSA